MLFYERASCLLLLMTLHVSLACLPCSICGRVVGRFPSKELMKKTAQNGVKFKEKYYLCRLDKQMFFVIR